MTRSTVFSMFGRLVIITSSFSPIRSRWCFLSAFTFDNKAGERSDDFILSLFVRGCQRVPVITSGLCCTPWIVLRIGLRCRCLDSCEE